MEFEIVQNVIIEVLGVHESEVKPETSFVDDLGADSLDLFQIAMGIEEKFDIELDPDRIKKVKTVGEAVELIKNLRN